MHYFFNILFFGGSLIYYLFEYLWNNNYKQFIFNIVNIITKSNILHVKLFQAISLDNNFIDETLHAELLQYTDSVPYTEDDIDYDTLIKVKTQYNLIFDNKQPINSGMISLVFKMKRLDTNETVIIKIKRKNIDDKIKESINNLLWVLSFFMEITAFNISQTIYKNIGYLQEQLDFEKEVKNTIDAKEKCKDLPYIKIPMVYKEVTEYYDNVIMLEYIDGLHISKISIEDYDYYAPIVLKYGIVSLIISGITHGDLHPGNILFIKNEQNEQLLKYQIGLIDFGIITSITDTFKNNMLEIANVLFTETGENLAIKLVNNIIECPDTLQNIPQIQLDNLYSEIGVFIDDGIREINKQKKQIFKLYNIIQKLNSLKKYNIIFNDDFYKLNMALGMGQGISMKLCKGDYITFANKVLNELFHIDLLDEK